MSEPQRRVATEKLSKFQTATKNLSTTTTTTTGKVESRGKVDVFRFERKIYSLIFGFNITSRTTTITDGNGRGWQLDTVTQIDRRTDKRESDNESRDLETD